MAAFGFLIIGTICALISRILLVMAAFRISTGWGLGVFLPFGPLVFRLNYPDEARSSRVFRLATLPCFFLYILLGPGPAYRSQIQHATSITAMPKWFGTEKVKPIAKKNGAGPDVQLQPSMEERRTANTHEFERLRVWSEKLHLKKRDLLHSDTVGNAAYAAEMAKYNTDLAKATAERAALWPAASATSAK